MSKVPGGEVLRKVCKHGEVPGGEVLRKVCKHGEFLGTLHKGLYFCGSPKRSPLDNVKLSCQHHKIPASAAKH